LTRFRLVLDWRLKFSLIFQHPEESNRCSSYVCAGMVSLRRAVAACGRGCDLVSQDTRSHFQHWRLIASRTRSAAPSRGRWFTCSFSRNPCSKTPAERRSLSSQFQSPGSRLFLVSSNTCLWNTRGKDEAQPTRQPRPHSRPGKRENVPSSRTGLSCVVGRWRFTSAGSPRISDGDSRLMHYMPRVALLCLMLEGTLSAVNGWFNACRALASSLAVRQIQSPVALTLTIILLGVPARPHFFGQACPACSPPRAVALTSNYRTIGVRVVVCVSDPDVAETVME
jgi:hypothetical protein